MLFIILILSPIYPFIHPSFYLFCCCFVAVAETLGPVAQLLRHFLSISFHGLLQLSKLVSPCSAVKGSGAGAAEPSAAVLRWRARHLGRRVCVCLCLCCECWCGGGGGTTALYRPGCEGRAAVKQQAQAGLSAEGAMQVWLDPNWAGLLDQMTSLAGQQSVRIGYVQHFSSILFCLQCG